jgi:hypothetical protein
MEQRLTVDSNSSNSMQKGDTRKVEASEILNRSGRGNGQEIEHAFALDLDQSGMKNIEWEKKN